MTDKLKMGVVGAGVFGGYHSGKCAEHPDVDFIGIYDPDGKKCRALADRYGVKAYGDYYDLLADIDALTIASPASAHDKQALAALYAGKHVYIEKPLATDYERARKIADLATRKNRIVQVGHQERFVIRAIGLDRVAERPVRIEALRFGPPSMRGTDTSVTLDLMTHDLDLILWLLGDMPSAVKGETQRIYSDQPDAALAQLYFPGTSVRLEASRVEDKSLRQMRLTYPSGEVEIDFNAKMLSHTTPFDLNSDFASHPQAKDSLGTSVDDFVQAALDGVDSMITAGHGLRAMKLALVVDGKVEI